MLIGVSVSEVRIIKRYANRKLYDTQASRYVTLEQISEMIREGDEVKIIDNKSKEDLTSVTMAQILFEEEKKQRSFLSLNTMRNLIQNGGEQITQFVNEAQRRVTNILPTKKGEGEGTPTVSKPKAKFLGELKEWFAHTQHSVEEWQKTVEARIRDAVGSAVDVVSPLSGVHREMKEITQRMAELEAKIREYEDQPEV